MQYPVHYRQFHLKIFNFLKKNFSQAFVVTYFKQEHSESADLCQGSSIPGLKLSGYNFL